MRRTGRHCLGQTSLQGNEHQFFEASKSSRFAAPLKWDFNIYLSRLNFKTQCVSLHDRLGSPLNHSLESATYGQRVAEAPTQSLQVRPTRILLLLTKQLIYCKMNFHVSILKWYSGAAVLRVWASPTQCIPRLAALSA